MTERQSQQWYEVWRWRVLHLTGRAFCCPVPQMIEKQKLIIYSQADQ
jgi:hypothetical protein